ncbi:heterokaryon incompatibility protein-domain-containing protein [Parachaetomium inaequale]|uniref:Heterokaryon incompatibility protein-domain-containing protein n=1 Tax=Parachaetomium inaequale TaxID=2588326 RepID=A0AAN6SNY7_9PEZI|nr:heterokaryon incompatibility protein-domain-containing protein [Parachaetomium inaequale]
MSSDPFNVNSPPQQGQPSNSNSTAQPDQNFNFNTPPQLGRPFNFTSAPQLGQPSTVNPPAQQNQPFNFNSPTQPGQPFIFNGPSQPSQPFTFGSSPQPAQPFNFTSSTPGNLNRPFQFTGANPPQPSLPTNPPPICPACSTLNLETALARAHALYEGARRRQNTRQLVTSRSRDGPAYLRDFYFVASLGRRLAETTTGNCRLCDFFREHTTTASGTRGTYKVLAICSSESYLFQAPRKDARGKWFRREGWGEMEYNVFLAVVPEVDGVPRTGVPLRWLETELPRQGAIYRLTKVVSGEQRVVLPREVTAEADMKWAGRWLACCRRNHLGCCAPRKPQGATMRGFRVIDCTKAPPVVVEVPWSEKYVALSYVWGPSTEDWPRTVTDAVHVTKELGERYLWVDRLCIDQNNLDEKMALIARMDDIYAGAEFSIVNAAGDARTGLPGVLGTQRTPQPRVELDRRPTMSSASNDSGDAYLDLLNVPEAEYEKETEGHTMWLDNFRHGLNKVIKIDLSEMLAKNKSQERANKYCISLDDLDFYEDSAVQLNIPFEEFMEKQKLLASKIGITFPELANFRTKPSSSPPCLNRVHAIRHSVWATRGWTYQEGVLSNRRLVFTPDQLYWECNAVALHESVELPMKILHVPSGDRKHLLFADYMLSGVFRGDMRAVPELQYGFREEGVRGVDEEVKRLDAHIRAFTGRKLTNGGDSLNAFLGVAARYSAREEGLALVQGIPVWTGRFADGRQPALQHTFAFSVSVWFHVARPVARRAEMYVVNCPRRAQFPSWSWIGWEEEGDDEDEEDNESDNAHIDFFMAMLKPEWVTSVDRLWSAQMVLHPEDGSHSTLLGGHVLNLAEFAGSGKNAGKKWLLTIKDPLVLKHLYLMHSSYGGWKRLMGKAVELHLSVPISEEELTAGHKAGNLMSVLIFASTVPFVWDGRARFLILRQVSGAGSQWERVGRLALTVEEWMMSKYKDSDDMVKDLPVKLLGKDISLV